ncbi:glutamyl-tRNA reductase, partial [Acinetobacter baumannii]
YGFDALAAMLPKADIIVAATDSGYAFIEDSHIKSMIEEGRQRPRLFLDLAVPHNMASSIASLPDCYLYAIDDLQSI